MTENGRRAPGLPTRLLKNTSSEPPHAQGHDEWLLDEALAETFPASDSIAVSPIHLRRASPPPRSRKVAASTKLSDGSIGRDRNVESAALGTPIECKHCHTEIAATVALNLEGADYIYHFCGPQCLEAWHTAGSEHDT